MFTLRGGQSIEQTPHTTLSTLLASGVGGQMAMEARGRLVAAAIPPLVPIAGIVLEMWSANRSRRLRPEQPDALNPERGRPERRATGLLQSAHGYAD